MTIIYLAKYLWSKKWLVIIPTILVVALACFFTRNLQPEYTSAAELSTGYMDASMLDHLPGGTTKVLFKNVIQTLQSAQVLDQVSYKLLYHDLSGTMPFRKIEEKQAVKEIVNNYPGGKAGLLNSLMHKIDSFYVLNLAINTDRQIRRLSDIYQYSPESILGKVHIDRVGESDFIKVVSSTEDPQLSAFISNEICNRFLALYRRRQGTASSTSIETLKNLVNTKKKILDNKLNLLQKTNEQAAASPDQMLNLLRAQLVQQKSDLIKAQAALTNVNNQISNADNNGGLAGNEEIIALRSNIDHLYEKYVKGGLEDQNLLNKIGKLRALLQQKLTNINGTAGGVSLGDLQKQKMELQVKVNVAKQTISDLQDNIHSIKSSIQSSAAQQGLIQGIQSEIKVARQQYVEANQFYNQALNRNKFPGNNFKQVLHANPPIHADPSKKVKIIGFAGAGIFFVLIFLFLFFEFIDPSIKTPAYLKANLPFPLLANLGRVHLKNPPIEDFFDADSSLSHTKKEFRDQVKQLRYEMESSAKRIFLFTGYHSGSGKTTIIESLAGSFSLKNKKVLLIDTNFHNNTLSRKYQAEATLENIELDADEPAAIEKIEKNTTSTGNENIALIGCGEGDYTPEEVLPEKNILSWFKKNVIKYDYILIDCAAVSEGPDCKELLQYVDTVIMLFAADQPLTEADSRFISFLKQNRVSTMGAVLNKINGYSMNG